MFQFYMFAMDAAKIPHDTRDWNSLDIFIFSNGQHYTPPRKYHLRSDELKYWDSTLKSLAHSQYGSLHSLIELYSMEGKKVEGPLELTNDAAYVAVTPPDPFIQAGYDKYLLKASRSWEKRQEKRLGTLHPAAQDDNNFGFSSIKVHKLSKDSTISDAEKEKNKSKSNIPIRNFKRPNSLSKSPLEKRKVLNPRSTVLRKNNNSRISSITAQSSQGKPTSNPKNAHPISKDTLNYASFKNKQMTNTILETEISNSKEDVITHRNEGNAQNLHESVTNLTRKTSKSDIVLTNTIAENDNDRAIDTEQHNVYRNLESDPISLFVDADKGFKTTTNNEPSTPPASPLKNNENVMDPKNNIIMLSNKQEKNNKEIKNSHDSGTQKSAVSIADTLKNIHNNECTINFNLNIEIKDFNTHSKYDSDTFSKKYRLNSDKTAKQSQTNLLVDLDKDFIATNNYINQLNTINPHVEHSCFGCENKVVIIRCSCNEKGNYNSMSENNLKPKECVLLPKNENMFERVDDVKKLHDPDVEEKKTTTIQRKDIINHEVTNSKIDSVKEYNVSMSTCSPAVSETLAQSSKNQENVLNCDKINIPSSTQTEWCNILVEARCNEDGNYSFHLPTIEKLKEFNL